MHKITIRRAVISDAEIIAQSFSDPSVYSGTLQQPYPSVEKWRDRLAFKEPNVVLVAEVDGKVVGHVGIHPEANRRRSHAANIGITVDAAMQGQGIGTALMAAVTDLADQWMNLLRIELTVFSDNQRAIALYQRFGFEEEGVMRGYAMREGRFIDALLMARRHPRLLGKDPA